MADYQSRLVREDAPTSQTPQMFQSLADRLHSFSNKQDDILDAQMQKKAKQKGLTDAQGKTEITLRTGETIADEAWNAGALSSYEAAIKLDAKDNMTRIAVENENDPEGFETAAKGYATGLLEGADDSVKPKVQDMLSSAILGYKQKAEAGRRTLEREQHASTLETSLTESMDSAIDSATAGDSDGMLESIIESMDYIDSLEEGGFITNKQATKRREDLDEATDEAVVMGQFNAARRAGKSDEYLKKFIDNPPKEINPDMAFKYAAIMDKAIARDNRIEKRINAEEVAILARARSKQASDLSIGVSRGQKTEVDVEKAYQDEVITANKRTSLIKELDVQTGKAIELSGQLSRVTASMNGGIPMSSRNKDDKKAVDAYYKDMSEGVDPFSDDAMNDTVSLVNSTTIMPTKVQELVQAYSKSGDPDQAVQAADFLARINEKTPQALSSVPADVKAFSLLVSRDVSAGMDGEQAVELARLNVYGTSEEEKRAFADEFKINTKDYREGNRSFLNDKIDDDFDPNLFDSQPPTPIAMEAEFNLMVEQYLPMTRDLEKAKELAYADLKNVWARTEINGSPEMSKYAPESYYGEGDWMRNQLISDVKEMTGAEGDINPQIIVDPRTAREANPSYFVTVLDENGVATPILDENNQPMRWIPDYNVSKEGKEQALELEGMLEAAKAEREQRTESSPDQPVRIRNLQGESFNMESAL